MYRVSKSYGESLLPLFINVEQRSSACFDELIYALDVHFAAKEEDGRVERDYIVCPETDGWIIARDRSTVSNFEDFPTHNSWDAKFVNPVARVWRHMMVVSIVYQWASM